MRGALGEATLERTAWGALALSLCESAEGTFQVNWLELTIRHEETGEVLYHNAWVTNWSVESSTVEGLAQAGRTRWKVEILKTKGYHMEHNPSMTSGQALDMANAIWLTSYWP